MHDVMFEPRGADTWPDPYSMYRELRDFDPVHHVVDGDYWVLSRFEDVFAAARDTARFSSAQGLTFNYGEREEIGLDISPMVMMDPPDHTAFRRLVARGFTPRAVSAIEPAVRRFVIERLDALCAAGGGDIIAALFKPLPSFVVAHYLGVPEDDRSRFDGWTDAIVSANAAGSALDAHEAVGSLVGYFGELIERRRAEPGDDTVSDLVRAEADGAKVDVLAVLGFAFTMVTGGNDTVTGLLGGATELLSGHRDQRDQLVADPAAIGPAIEEFLRLTSPVQGLARMTTEPVVIGDIEIPADRKVMLLYASANRDSAEFGPTAEELDVKRQINRQMSFSYGAHHCLGAAAARLEGRVAIEELLTRCPNFEVDNETARFASGHFVRRHEFLEITT